MPLAGTLTTMSLPDLLQWLSAARKTGTLLVERDKVAKTIRLREGCVVGCSSDDPPQRLGQFLLYQEKITEEQLLEALRVQEQTHEYLGQILIQQRWISSEDLTAHLESNLEETLYSLFDWADGVFRFDETSGEAEEPFPLHLRVEDVLLRGLRRYDEMKRIREVFCDPNLVLRYTSKPPSPEIFQDPARRAMYLTIDGERTIAEIVLHLHGCDYTVQKFLFDLHRDGYVEISYTRSPAAEPEPVPQPAVVSVAAETPAAEEPVPAQAAPEPVAAPETDAGPAEASPLPDIEPLEELSLGEPLPELPPELAAELSSATRLLDEHKYEEALDVLDRLYRSHPADDSLRRLTAEAEAAFLDRTYRHAVPPQKVPVLRRPVENLESACLSPEEFFMLSRIDGTWDVKSIIQVAPLREVQALRTLKRMRELGMIELRDSE